MLFLITALKAVIIQKRVDENLCASAGLFNLCRGLSKL
jgi:hypothetical protein